VVLHPSSLIVCSKHAGLIFKINGTVIKIEVPLVLEVLIMGIRIFFKKSSSKELHGIICFKYPSQNLPACHLISIWQAGYLSSSPAVHRLAAQ